MMLLGSQIPLEAGYQQLPMVELLIPGFAIISNMIGQIFSGQLSGCTRILCLFVLVALSKSYLLQLRDWFLEFFQWKIHIRPYEETYNMVQGWILSHKSDCTARSVLVTIGARQDNEDIFNACSKKPLSYLPWEGVFYFWYKKNLLIYRTTHTDLGFRIEEKVSISCISRSPSILKDFMSECHRQYLKTLRNKTIIYKNQGNNWKIDSTVDTRPLSTVILNECLKETVVKDLAKFLDPETRRWYSDRRIPYKRGYLFYGPPGTGKTSFSISIAGELDMNIYIFSIPNIDDRNLEDLFASLPERCIALLEDIDVIGASSPQHFNPSEPHKNRDIRCSPGRVSLSSILNTLDGVSSQVNRIFILTTNHLHKLDKAIIRPGRVDMKAEFELASKSIAKAMFTYMLGGQENIDTEEQSEAFAERVPDSKFSPAEIMNYLQRYCKAPAGAVENCGKWVDNLLEEKRMNK
ncbi:unnamed protein product [Clonostachys chloroleuca]|uniref:AAA+ ATPase domain-containing protein n=2 Tax=Clonostachys TaxID=110564 RepID=A0A8H7NHF4_BIOOC|nr:unnamed protein product [Clonostachys chloroleuca]